MRPRLPFVASAIAVSLLGCHRLDRLEECRALSDAVNPVLRAIDLQRRKNPEGVTAYRAISMQYAALAARLLVLKPEGKPLAEAIGDYQKLFADASRDARSFSDALESRDKGRIAQARSNATRTTKREAPIASRISGICRQR
jgi:hypothetical protein